MPQEIIARIKSKITDIMIDTAAITICSLNYLSKALVLAKSYLRFHPEHNFYILLVDQKINDLIDLPPSVRIIWVEDLGIPDVRKAAFAFDVIEFNTNVKPSAMASLLDSHDVVIYLDPDIEVFAPLEPVFNALEESSIVVTPHCNTPVLDGHKPDDLEFMRFGTFNLGFVAVSNCDEAFAFLKWWSDRCLAYGFYEPQSGLAVDQKWVGLAPSYFPGLRILHDVGLNLAFWNLHERSLSIKDNSWMVNETTLLRFVHFSSFDVSNPDRVAKKQDRYKPGSRPDFSPLAHSYARKLSESPGSVYGNRNYSFDYFDDGVYINPTLRRFYAALKDEMFAAVSNPFSSDSPVRRFGENNGLIRKGNAHGPRQNFKDMQAYGKHIRIILVMLRAVLRILGPNRYFSLMRFLAHISSIRNQADMFRKR